MYNEKVLDHFRNPRNQGAIENADGIGQVGNPVCILPGEKIFLNSKFENIIKVAPGFFVFSHDFSKNKILNKSIRNYNGAIITLKNCFGKISLTPEHLILAMKLPKHYDFFRTKNKQKLIPAWYHAGQLEKKDVILYPRPKAIKDIKFIKINAAKLKYDFKSKEMPSQVPLNQSLMRLFGYFMAEGNVCDRISKTCISFTLNISERDIIDDIKKISKDLFGLEAKIQEKPKVKTAVVFLYSARLARFFKELFGNGAENKYFPEFIMALPLLKQKSLIAGLWRGDGYVNLKRVGPRAGYATVSYQLAQQIKNFLLRQKIASSIYIDPAKKINGVNHKKAYRIHVGQRDSLIKLAGILGKKYSPNSYQSISPWFDDDYFYTPITDIKRINYRGKVYNLEVESAHSFISEAFCLHNCGDIMKIYIKVGKNKKGKETIKDIKFETLGCGAAIATSSMLTEMVKGKTIEEALKIKKLDIADELGGLPSVKLHCSILAHEGLEAAVKDYQSKKLIN